MSAVTAAGAAAACPTVTALVNDVAVPFRVDLYSDDPVAVTVTAPLPLTFADAAAALFLWDYDQDDDMSDPQYVRELVVSAVIAFGLLRLYDARCEMQQAEPDTGKGRWAAYCRRRAAEAFPEHAPAERGAAVPNPREGRWLVVAR